MVRHFSDPLKAHMIAWAVRREAISELAFVFRDDEAFRSAVSRVQAAPGPEQAAQAHREAGRYRQKGAGRQVIARMLLAAAELGPAAAHPGILQTTLSNLGDQSFWADEEPPPGSAQRGRRSGLQANLRLAATLLARRAAGKCLAPDCDATISDQSIIVHPRHAQRVDYCPRHAIRAHSRPGASDQYAIRQLLRRAIGAAIPGRNDPIAVLRVRRLKRPAKPSSQQRGRTSPAFATRPQRSS